MPYSSSFEAPSELAHDVLYAGGILDSYEKPNSMVERVTRTLAREEEKYPIHDRNFENHLGEIMDAGKVVMSTPIMTNAGRYAEKPLSACTMPTLGLDAPLEEIAKEIDTLHQQGMGTGFNLSELNEPVRMLRFLNDRAVAGAKSGKEDRPVGNMAILDIGHPKIKEFIAAKLDAPDGEYPWKFNISIDVDDKFMAAVEAGGAYELRDGTKTSASSLFSLICESARQSADPGLIFLDRMNERNPVPGLGTYKTTAPCAEVGLIEGEACQFGYINLGSFVELDARHIPIVDYDGIYDAARTMTRALDNALDVSLENFITDRSRYVMSNKRKIGIGICGLADAISIAGMAYDSPGAREFALDLLNLVNFASKEESMLLGKERGACGAMDLIVGNKYFDTPSHLDKIYGDLTTRSVAASDWAAMAHGIKETRNLRNITTIALPPTGRSALVIDASTGVEAHFTVGSANQKVRAALQRHAGATCMGVFNRTNVREAEEALLHNATSISAMGHLSMAATLQRATDEAISKTVNLPHGAASEDIAAIYREAYRAGMSGVTVYVNGTFGELQPKVLDKKLINH